MEWKVGTDSSKVLCLKSRGQWCGRAVVDTEGPFLVEGNPDVPWCFPGSSASKESRLQCRWPRFNSWDGKIPWRRDKLPTLVFLGFPGGSDGKESARNAGDLGSIPELGRCPGEGHGNALQYSCLENPHGQRSLVGYSPWSHKELDVTEQLSTAHTFPVSGCVYIYF